MLRNIFLVAASSCVLMGTTGFAQSTDDVRCLMLSNAFAQGGSTPEAKKAAQSGGLFFLGRIDGRWTDVQLRAAIAQHQKTLKVDKAGPEMQACLRRVEASYKKIQAIAPPPKQKR